MAPRVFCVLIWILVMSTTVFSADTLKKLSSKFFKTKESYHAQPIGVCYPQRLGGKTHSIKWVCNKDVNGKSYINSFRYNNVNCSGNGDVINTFTDEHKHRFPFNCDEDGEEDEYESSYMILKVSAAKQTVYNEGDDDDEEFECNEVDKENGDYRTKAIITNQCTLSWKQKEDGTFKPYWYFAMCSQNASYIEKWDGEDCTGNMQWPQYTENGCHPKRTFNKDWYYQIVECTHPANEYILDHEENNNGNKQRNIIFNSIIIIFAVLCILSN